MWRFALRLLLASAVVPARRLARGPLRPTWSLRLEVLVTALRYDWSTLWKEPVEFIREYQAELAQPTEATRAVTLRRADDAPVRCTFVEPPDPVDDALVLYFHGGSYQFGSLATHFDLVARLALETRRRIVVPEYRLAPEHPHPAQLEDAKAVWDWLVRQFEPQRITVAGESAGGHLALGLALSLREAQRPLPAAVLAVSPWLDLASTNETMQTHAEWDYGSREMLLAQAAQFAGGALLTDPLVSPMHATLTGLPPLVLQVGGAELLFGEVAAFAKAARSAGVDVTLDVLPDMPHAVLLFAQILPEGRDAIALLARRIRERCPVVDPTRTPAAKA